MKIFTIGFTQKTAEQFFNLLAGNQVEKLIDVRLNNKSQLAGFAKVPDLEYFLNKLCGIDYIHDPMLAPSEFESMMKERNIDRYIEDRYAGDKDRSVCLLCSEATADQCHRRLIADHFSSVFDSETIHL